MLGSSGRKTVRQNLLYAGWTESGWNKMNANAEYLFKQIAELQTQYQKLVDTKSLSKKALCDLCVPFRDEYGLTDLQTLMIVRKEMDISEIIDLFEKRDGCK